LTDFPSTVAAAEVLEQYKGGVNAFVHLSLPDEVLVDIEDNKISCGIAEKFTLEILLVIQKMEYSLILTCQRMVFAMTADLKTFPKVVTLMRLKKTCRLINKRRMNF